MQDCSPGALKHLNFTELFTISDSPDCLNEARSVFNLEYNSTIFVFGGDRVMEEATPFIFINDTNLIKRTLDKFGDLILGPITLRFAHLSYGREVVEHINDKCSKTLEKLEINDCFGTVLHGLKNTFGKVKELVFENSRFHDIELSPDANHKLNIIFPNVEILKFEALMTPSWRFVFGKFSKLKSLIIESFWMSSLKSVDESHFAKFFQTNTQIESLDVSNCNLKLIRIASDHLPQLKTLKLVRPSEEKYEGTPIHLKNVNEFSLRLDEQQQVNILDKIVFDLKLEKLELNAPVETSSSNNWFEFITNQNLTHLELHYKNLTNDQFSNIPITQRKLQNVRITCEATFSATEIINFVENSKELNHFKMTAEMSQDNQSQLKTALQTKWDVSCINLLSCSKVVIEINPKK